MSIVVRIQDAEGRGPFRPGFSRMWIDDDEPAPLLPTYMEEFGEDIFARCGRTGEHFGSAVRTPDQLTRWFNAKERARLAGYGFRVVQFNDARIIAESPNQVVFGRSRPLSDGGMIRRWP